MGVTVQNIVAKYRGLTENMTRQRRRYVPDFENDDAEKQIECFWRDLVKKSRVEQIGSYLLLFDSQDRIEALWHAVFDEPVEIFWPVFIEWWNACDDTWRWRSILLDTLKYRTTQGAATNFLSAENKAFSDSLPGRFPVFRGSSRARVRGLAWTTDHTVTEGFAHGHRMIPVPDPVVSSAQIDKTAVFFVSVDRGESEVVLNPRRLRRLRVEPYTRAAAA
jgi:hypothetical protein